MSYQEELERRWMIRQQLKMERLRREQRMEILRRNLPFVALAVFLLTAVTLALLVRVQ